MWTILFDQFMNRLMQTGRLNVTFSNGQRRTYGTSTPEISVTFHDPRLPRRIIRTPDLAVGEAYTDGTLSIENDDLEGFLDLCIMNAVRIKGTWLQRPIKYGRYLMRRLQQFNPARRAQRNVAHHYDLSGELYELFLDADRQYSCACFTSPDISLEDAQSAKKHIIARKLCLEPGMRVLDIGCGWGGMALTLARDYGANVTGITLSKEQQTYATQRAAREGLSDQVTFHLRDYRQLNERFDRIVSIGMFEHVGLPYYKSYFDTVRRLLPDDGIALIHTIGRSGPPGITSPWIAKYIFPGGYIPALSETARPIEEADLIVNDVEVWRMHYAQTLHHWHKRFMKNIDQARTLYDERFCRMWRFYLLACEKTFRYEKQVVFQFQLSPRKDSVPLTRDYIYR